MILRFVYIVWFVTRRALQNNILTHFETDSGIDYLQLQ